MSFEDATVNGGVAAPPAESSPASEPQGLPTVDEMAAYLRENNAFTSDEPEAASAEVSDAAPAEGSETEVQATPAEDDSSGGTAAGTERSQFIPRDRFDEVNSRLKDTTTRLQQLEALATYDPVLQRFQALGLTPEQVLQLMDQPAPVPAPPPAAAPPPPPVAASVPEAPAAPAVDPFEAFCAEHGVEDPFALEPNVYAAVRAAFAADQRTQQQLAEFRKQVEDRLNPVSTTLEQMQAAEAARQQQAEELARQQQLAREQAQLAEWKGELAAISEKYPVFKDQENLADLVARWNQMPEGTTLTQTAEGMYGRWSQIGNVAARNQLAENALAEAAAAKERPAMAGGAPPSPARIVDYAELSPQDMMRHTREALRTAMANNP